MQPVIIQLIQADEEGIAETKTNGGSSSFIQIRICSNTDQQSSFGADPAPAVIQREKTTFFADAYCQHEENSRKRFAHT